MALSTSEWPGAEIEIPVENFSLYIYCFVAMKKYSLQKKYIFLSTPYWQLS